MYILILYGKLCIIIWQPKFTIQTKPFSSSDLYHSKWVICFLLCLCQYLMVKYASGIWKTYFTIRTLPCWIWMVNFVLYFVSHSLPSDLRPNSELVWLLLVNGKIIFVDVKTKFTIRDHQNTTLLISGSVEFRGLFH